MEAHLVLTRVVWLEVNVNLIMHAFSEFIMPCFAAGDTIDVMGNGYHKRRKGSNSDEEGSSDGEHTLELASSHSSDEDEAMSRHGPIRTEKIGKLIWLLLRMTALV